MIAATAGGAGRRSRAYRAGMWLGHYEPRMTPFVYVLILWNIIGNLWFSASLSTITSNAIAAMMPVFIVAMLCSDWVHGRNLCPRDLDDTLLDPQGAVNKNMRRLVWWHRPLWWQLLRGAVGFALIALLATSLRLRGMPWPVRGMLTLVAIPGAAMVVYSAMAMHTHRRLQRWCTLCWRGGRGPKDQVPEPQPDPDPVNTISR